MEASLLRGILLFNSREKRLNRDEMMQKALFSIILEGKGEYTDDQILSVFSDRFKTQLDKTSLARMKKKLQEEKHLNASGLPIEQEKGRDFFESIENETEALYDGIIQKVEKSLNTTLTNHPILKDNIRNALSVYYKMYGYAFFDLQESVGLNDPEKAIQAAMTNLDKRTGESLVRAIAYTLKYPTERDALILEQWARAFVTMQILGLDPTLKNFQATRLREKEFILDTDFVLRCLTTEAEHCQAYHIILHKLLDIKCKLYIPAGVRKEVEEHVASARSTYLKYGDRVKTYFDEIFKTGIPNVFIEDYVKQKNGAKPDLTFDVYIRNYNSSFLHDRMERTFGKEIFSHTLPEDSIDEGEVKMLADKILPHTENTYLGEKSTDERNKDISRVDAILYLVTKKKNQGTEGGSILSRKTYLVTKTTRSMRAAKECGLFTDNIVCNPDALMVFLKETGSVDMNDVRIINLFENPFLTHTARQIWDKIEPFVKKQAVFMKHEAIEVLRYDVDLCLDNGLTGNNGSTKSARQNRKTNLGILLPEDVLKLQGDLESLKKQLARKNRDLESSQEDYRLLQLEHAKQKAALDRIRTRVARSGTARIDSNRTKRKRR